jgi:hypothetical protein
MAEATTPTLMTLWGDTEPAIHKAPFLEDAAQRLVTAIYDQFEDSVVLARMFLTVPFLALPPSNEAFVRGLAESAGVTSSLKATTAVLSLLGTRGRERDWNDRRLSKGHLGIPLVSSAFVDDSIPMISRVLKELGVPLHWVDSLDSEVVLAAMGRAASLFFVEDAARATDHQGRKIIVAQDFVSRYKVVSVFGTGSAYPNGQILVLIVFCNEAVPRSVAEQFLALVEMFKQRTKTLAATTRIFAEGFVR